MANYCSNCATALEFDARFCPSCSSPVGVTQALTSELRAEGLNLKNEPQSDSVEGSIKIQQSLLRRAVNNDPEALSLMFHQFIPPDEEIKFVEFLGINGFWGLGQRSFACVTEKRLASLRVGAFKEVIYQDGYLEHTNSGIVYQPSRLKLYVFLVIAAFISLWLTLMVYAITYSIANPYSRYSTYSISEDSEPSVILPVFVSFIAFFLFLFLTSLIAVKLFHRFVKCGLVSVIREGVSIYIFANRSKLLRANHLYRICTALRDERIRSIRENL